MSGPRLGALVLVVAGLLAGCGSGDDGAAGGPGRAQIDVDTPQLRQAKEQAGVERCRPAAGSAVEGGLPDVTLPCFGGGRDVELGALRGPAVVNVWASWCGPCRDEMPVLQRFHERYGEQVPIVGIDYEDPQVEAAMELVRESGVTYPLLADPQSRLRGAAPFPARMGLPLFAFVDADGRAQVVAGGVESLGELTDLVEERLGVSL